MAALREMLRLAGLEDVTTVAQSGNVLCRCSASEHEVAATVAEAIEQAAGMRVGVVVRTAAELVAVAGRNPFLGAGCDVDPARLHVAFLTQRPAPSDEAALDPGRSRPDAFVVSGREVYLHYPSGSGRTRLTLDYLERQLGVTGTARNWRTVQRLASLGAE
jgi:uncharacterized protein (DUF1697 family)